MSQTFALPPVASGPVEDAVGRKVAELREAALNAVGADDIVGVMRALLRKASEGCVQAAKLVLGYTLGRPANRTRAEGAAAAQAAAPVQASTAQECQPRTVVDTGPSPNGTFGAPIPPAASCNNAPSLRDFFADLHTLSPLVPPNLHADGRAEKPKRP